MSLDGTASALRESTSWASTLRACSLRYVAPRFALLTVGARPGTFA